MGGFSALPSAEQYNRFSSSLVSHSGMTAFLEYRAPAATSRSRAVSAAVLPHAAVGAHCRERPGRLARQTVAASANLVVSAMPRSRAMCAKGFSLACANCTASNLNSRVKVRWFLLMVLILPLEGEDFQFTCSTSLGQDQDWQFAFVAQQKLETNTITKIASLFEHLL